MRFATMKTAYMLAFLAGIFFQSAAYSTEQPLPKGLMLNLDFQNARDRLIPNKAFYPLHVPQGNLPIKTLDFCRVLGLESKQGLDIPHSLLLEPNGDEWIVTVRILARSDGMVLSQGNDEFGYAIYLKKGIVHAAIRTGNSTIVMREDPDSGITDCRKEWVAVELRIKPDMALLTLNRKRSAIALLQAPLKGENMQIRLGNHHRLPAVIENLPAADPTGFAGFVSSLKIWRR